MHTRNIALRTEIEIELSAFDISRPEFMLFASSYVYEQVFSTMKLRKICIRNRLTFEQLNSLPRISIFRFELDYLELLEMQSQHHSLH